MRIDRATAGGHLFTVSHFFNVSFNKILDFCWVDLARLIVTNLQNHKSESNELLRFSQYLRNSTSQYVFVFFFVDVFLIVMRLENQLNFFDYSFLSVKFFQELKIKFIYTITYYTTITPYLILDLHFDGRIRQLVQDLQIILIQLNSHLFCTYNNMLTKILNGSPPYLYQRQFVVFY